MCDQEDVRKNAGLFPFSPGLGGPMHSKKIKVKRMGGRRVTTLSFTWLSLGLPGNNGRRP